MSICEAVGEYLRCPYTRRLWLVMGLLLGATLACLGGCASRTFDGLGADIRAINKGIARSVLDQD